MKRRQKEALAAASGACAGGCAAAVQMREELDKLRAEHERTVALFKAEADQHFAVETETERRAQGRVRQLEAELRGLHRELAGARAEATALRQQIDFERSLRRGLTP